MSANNRMTVNQHMTAMLHTIGAETPVKTAEEQMREHRIRHLPVQKGGKLVGVVSDRDLRLVTAREHDQGMRVEDLMVPDPYVVKPDALLETVASEMARHKYGCALVADGSGRCIGIFTATDGMRVLSELLKARG